MGVTTDGFSGSANRFTGGGSLYNAINFMIKNAQSQNASCHIVKVVAVVEDSGGKDKPPMVKCQIMVDQVDGLGNRSPRATIFDLPAHRHQAGSNGIINDPQVGDIGTIVVCDSDISNVKATKDNSAPASFRQGNYSDGLYFGGFINKPMVAYIEFTEDGVINIITPMDINITPDGNLNVTVKGNTTIHTTGTTSVQSDGALSINAPNIVLDTAGHLSVTGDVTAFNGSAAVSLEFHEHSLVTTGTEISGPPVPT